MSAVTMAIVTQTARSIEINWRWRSSDGSMRFVENMHTSHLFYTLRMIWNNFMPDHMQVGRVKRYHYPPIYTDVYMGQAILNIGSELLTRDNILPWMQAELDEMTRWFGYRLPPAAEVAAIAAPS